jgi:hypothetical protein
MGRNHRLLCAGICTPKVGAVCGNAAPTVLCGGRAGNARPHRDSRALRQHRSYNMRANVETLIGPYKHAIGDEVRFQTDNPRRLEKL